MLCLQHGQRNQLGPVCSLRLGLFLLRSMTAAAFHGCRSLKQVPQELVESSERQGRTPDELRLRLDLGSWQGCQAKSSEAHGGLYEAKEVPDILGEAVLL